MGIFKNHYNTPGPGISKDAPRKKGIALFFDIFLREFFDLLKLNLLFLLFCVPIVTIPAAFTAMSKITVTMVRDENHFLWTDFWSEFKADFVKSLGAGALVFLGSGMGAFGLWFYNRMAANSLFFYFPLGLSLLFVMFLTIMGFYIFPMIALVNLPLKKIIHNAFLLTFVCFHYNLLTIVIVGVLSFLCIGFFPYTLPVLLLLWFSFINLMTTFCAYYGIQRYVICASDEQKETGE